MASRAKSKDIEVRRGAGGDSAYISGTRTRVVDVARLYLLAQEEVIIERMLRSMPHLTPAQITAALEYWRAHPDEIDGAMREEAELIEQIPVAK